MEVPFGRRNDAVGVHLVPDQPDLVDQQAACVLDPSNAIAGRQRLRPDGGGGPAGEQQREFAQACQEACRHAGGRAPVQRADQRVGLEPRQRAGLGGCAAPGRVVRKPGVCVARFRQFDHARGVVLGVEQRCAGGRSLAPCAGRGIVVAHLSNEACRGGRPGIEPAVELGQRDQCQPFVGVDAEGCDRDALGGRAGAGAGARVGRRRKPEGERSARCRDRIVARRLADPLRPIEQSAPGIFAHRFGRHRGTATRQHVGCEHFGGGRGAGQFAGGRLRAAADREQQRYRRRDFGARSTLQQRARHIRARRGDAHRPDAPVAHAQADAQLAFRAHGRLARQA